MGNRLSVSRRDATRNTLALRRHVPDLTWLDSRKPFLRTKNRHYPASQLADSCSSSIALKTFRAAAAKSNKKMTREEGGRKNPEGENEDRAKTGCGFHI